jgi:hypothetical protein
MDLKPQDQSRPLLSCNWEGALHDAGATGGTAATHQGDLASAQIAASQQAAVLYWERPPFVNP